MQVVVQLTLPPWALAASNAEIEGVSPSTSVSLVSTELEPPSTTVVAVPAISTVTVLATATGGSLTPVIRMVAVAVSV